jgi:hypothetical protein
VRSILILSVVFGAACTGRAGAPARPRAGTISVEWTGKLRGRFSAPATARWCAADTLLEVIAVRGDTAVGLSLIAPDSVRAEVYAVNEAQNFTPGRPQANVALRMLGEVILLGFEGMGGKVVVTEGGPVISGTLDVKLRPVSSSDTLQIKGSFDRIPVAPATGACGRANKPGGG